MTNNSKLTGKCSTFGGPKDTGMSETEGLAIYPNWDAVNKATALSLFSNRGNLEPRGRGLDPNAFYCAMRWDYSDRSRVAWASSWIKITFKGKVCYARPVDWGPNERTDRLIDLSPGVAKFLGLKTDDTVEVEIL